MYLFDWSEALKRWLQGKGAHGEVLGLLAGRILSVTTALATSASQRQLFVRTPQIKRSGIERASSNPVRMDSPMQAFSTPRQSPSHDCAGNVCRWPMQPTWCWSMVFSEILSAELNTWFNRFSQKSSMGLSFPFCSTQNLRTGNHWSPKSLHTLSNSIWPCSHVFSVAPTTRIRVDWMLHCWPCLWWLASKTCSAPWVHPHWCAPVWAAREKLQWQDGPFGAEDPGRLF